MTPKTCRIFFLEKALRNLHVPERCAQNLIVLWNCITTPKMFPVQGLPWRVREMRAIQRTSCLRWRRWCVVRRQKSGGLSCCSVQVTQVLYQNVTLDRRKPMKNCYSWDSTRLYFKMNRKGLTVWCSLILDLTKCSYIIRIPYWRWGYHPHSNNFRPCIFLWLSWEMKMQWR